MRFPSSPALLFVLGYLYQALLVLYPKSFRRAYGPQMSQVFRTACRQTQRRDGMRGLVLLSGRTLGDLVWSSLGERMTRLYSWDVLARVTLSLIAVLLAFLASSLHGHHDADSTALLVLLAGSFLCGVLRPKEARWWALLIGVGLLAGRMLGPLTGITWLPRTDADLPLLFLPIVVAAYGGALVRWVVARHPGLPGGLILG